MGKEYPKIQMQSVSQPKLTKNRCEHCIKQRGFGWYAKVNFTQNIFSFLQFPLQVVDLRPWPNSKGFSPYMYVISYIQLFWKPASLSFKCCLNVNMLKGHGKYMSSKATFFLQYLPPKDMSSDVHIVLIEQLWQFAPLEPLHSGK